MINKKNLLTIRETSQTWAGDSTGRLVRIENTDTASKMEQTEESSTFRTVIEQQREKNDQLTSVVELLF